MLTIYALPTTRPDDSQLEAIADCCGGGLPLPIEVALCVRWLAIRQRHKAMTPRDRVNLTMTDHLDLIANARATIQNIDLASIKSIGGKYNLTSVGSARGGPSLQDLPMVLRQAKVGALLIWSTKQMDRYPMAAYRSGGSLRGLGPDTLSLYTAQLGELAPIKISDIQSQNADAIRGDPDPIVDCRAVLLQLSEQVASAETDVAIVKPSAMKDASKPSKEVRRVQFAARTRVAEYFKDTEKVQVFRRIDLDDNT